MTLFDSPTDRPSYGFFYITRGFSQIETLLSMSWRLLGELAHFLTELVEEGLLK